MIPASRSWTYVAFLIDPPPAARSSATKQLRHRDVIGHFCRFKQALAARSWAPRCVKQTRLIEKREIPITLRRECSVRLPRRGASHNAHSAGQIHRFDLIFRRRQAERESNIADKLISSRRPVDQRRA
jgi:hypothetical protein